jgi:hypothetical protein
MDSLNSLLDEILKETILVDEPNETVIKNLKENFKTVANQNKSALKAFSKDSDVKVKVGIFHSHKKQEKFVNHFIELEHRRDELKMVIKYAKMKNNLPMLESAEEQYELVDMQFILMCGEAMKESRLFVKY